MLIIVMMIATLLLIALAATLPSVYQEGQREREQELIFRGTQYAKAVYLFHKQFNRYPVSTKELLQTNGMRFLRQEYRDPMDPKGKWRFIHVNAAGVLLDSLNQPMRNNSNNPNPAGVGTNNSNNSSFGGSSSFGNNSSFGSNSSFGNNSSFGGNSSFGNSSSMGGSSFGSSSFGNSSMGMQGSSFGGTGMNSSTNSGQGGAGSSLLGNTNGVQGAYIAGVAATSHHDSIKTWQKHNHYDEWEFIGIDMGIFGMQVGMPGGAGSALGGINGLGQQPGSQGFGSSQGGFGSSQGGFGSSQGGFGNSNSNSNFGSNSNSNFGSPSN